MDYNIYAGFWYSYNGYWMRWVITGLLAIIMICSWLAAITIQPARSYDKKTNTTSSSNPHQSLRLAILRWVFFVAGMLGMLSSIGSMYYFNGLAVNDVRQMEAFYGVQNIVLDKGEAFGNNLVQNVRFTDSSGLHTGKLTISGNYRTATLWINKSYYQGSSGEYVKYKPQFAVDSNASTKKQSAGKTADDPQSGNAKMNGNTSKSSPSSK